MGWSLVGENLGGGLHGLHFLQVGIGHRAGGAG
jgi:hypothetical protein